MTRARLLRGAATLAAACVVAVAGLLLGARLGGPSEVETELGRVSLEARPSVSGVIDAYVPIADWGVRAESFDAPVELKAEIRAIDRSGAIGIAGGDAGSLDAAVAALGDGARTELVRAALFGVGGVAALALVVFGIWRRPLIPLLSIGVGVVLAGGGLAAAAVSYDERSFSEPRFYGRGQELAQLIDFFERQQGNERYTSTFDGALTNFSAYLSGGSNPGDGPGLGVVFGSDLHNNPLPLPTLREFAAGKPVLLAGDFGIDGNEAEARALAPRLAEVGDDVLAVSGNHDSAGLMSALARSGITVLTSDGVLRPNGKPGRRQLVRVDGLVIAGFSDPLEWQGPDPDSPERVFSFPELENGEELEAEAREEVVAWFEGLPRRPDIAMVHQNELASHLAATLAEAGDGQPLTIVTGHNHRQSVDRFGADGEIVVVNGGTLGAGGFLRLGQESLGLGQLHLPAGSTEPDWVDLIRVEPLSGQAEAGRAVLDVICPPGEASDDPAVPCEYEPEG
ncbi:hypothetical protein HJD18_03235 [Thermoleophilia bacterium SCSIO 60948]|nr:hypothetical protein HJD18_03235 [Thermoleophilia bacterium SCSIO 60948]